MSLIEIEALHKNNLLTNEEYKTLIKLFIIKINN